MRRRDVLITCFVILWSLVFHYETLRLSYLSPWVGRELPKLKFLFPPAGWIMFYRVDAAYGFAEVHGLRRGEPVQLDPHAIFENRALGYDNIRRNVLVSVLSPEDGPAFCAYLRRKFPEYDRFAVLYGQYPDVVHRLDEINRQVMYRCE